jgi:hypothetical protein
MTLTDKQIEFRLELARNLAEAIVEGMDMDTLVSFATDQLQERFDEYTEAQLVAEAKEYYPHLLEE